MSAIRKIDPNDVARFDALSHEAKRLRPKTIGMRESGVRTAVHATSMGPANPRASVVASGENVFSGPWRNEVRGRARQERARMLLVAVAAHVSYAEVGAALNCDKDAAYQAVRGKEPFDLGDTFLVLGRIDGVRIALGRALLEKMSACIGRDLVLALCLDVFGVQAVMAAVQRGGELGR